MPGMEIDFYQLAVIILPTCIAITRNWDIRLERRISRGRTPAIQDLSRRPWDLSVMKDSEVSAMAKKNIKRQIIPDATQSRKSESPIRGVS